MNHSHRDGKRPCGNAYPCHTRRATLKCTLLSCHPIKPTTQLIFLYGDGKVHFTRSQLPRLSPNAVLRSSIVMAYVRGAPWGSSHLACVRVLRTPRGSPTRRSRRPRSSRPPRRSSQARGHTVESSPCVRLPLLRILLAKWNPTGKGRRAAPDGAAPVNPTCFLHVSWAKRSVVTHTNYRRALKNGIVQAGMEEQKFL